VSISGMRLTNGIPWSHPSLGTGYIPQDMGGLVISAEALTLNQVQFDHGEANQGGALAIIGGSLDLTQCAFRENSSVSGGAIYVDAGMSIKIGSCLFTENRASYGSAICCASLPVPGCIHIEVSNSTFASNTVKHNDTIHSFGNHNIAHCTFVNNATTQASPYTRDTYTRTEPKKNTVRNCVFAGNTGPEGSRLELITVFGDWPVNVSHSIISGETDDDYIDEGNNQIGIAPKLGPLADNGGPTMTHALLPGSPAIDTGANSELPVDARGEPRKVDGDGIDGVQPDIGAFEVQ